MKKEYASPEFELMKFQFGSILEEHLITHSIGEDGAEGGAEGRD